MSIYLRFFRLFDKPTRGFTLVELLVVVLIILLITGFILFRQGGFNSSTLLRSLAYSVALSVRQAQTYGISVRESGAGTFAPGYGLYFTTGDQTHYRLFADVNGDRAHASDGSEDLPAYTLGRDYKITRFCGTLSGVGTQVCWSQASPGSLTIYFRRPNPDALFYSSNPAETYSSVYIQLSSQSGDTRSVTVTSAGQIAVGTAGS